MMEIAIIFRGRLAIFSLASLMCILLWRFNEQPLENIADKHHYKKVSFTHWNDLNEPINFCSYINYMVVDYHGCGAKWLFLS
jgi:hypothetical protein